MKKRKQKANVFASGQNLLSGFTESEILSSGQLFLVRGGDGENDGGTTNPPPPPPPPEGP